MQPKNPVKTFLNDSDGTTAVEYCVMLAAILLAMMLGLAAAGSGVASWWGNIDSELDSNGF
ncbi:MAG: Flp family type IVb pilin [Fuerstiella sp.]